LKNKGQSLTEYVLILSVVLSAVIGMEVYAKRAIQAKVKDLTDLCIASKDSHLDNTTEIIPLLDAASGKITASESHIKKTITETPTDMTFTKGTADGESFYLYSESEYQSKDPDEEVSTAGTGSEGALAVSGIKIGQISSRFPTGE